MSVYFIFICEKNKKKQPYCSFLCFQKDWRNGNGCALHAVTCTINCVFLLDIREEHVTFCSRFCWSRMAAIRPCRFRAEQFIKNVSKRYFSQGEATDASRRIAAAAIVTRPPLLLPKATEFETKYDIYAQRKRRYEASEFPVEYWFKPGSTLERTFSDKWQKTMENDQLESFVEHALPIDYTAEYKELNVNVEEYDTKADADLTRILRRPDRTLHLLIRSKEFWKFPQSIVSNADMLIGAARRQLLEDFGSNVELFWLSNGPAGHWTLPNIVTRIHGEALDQATDVFFMRAHILAGTLSTHKKSEEFDWAWLTREEILDRLDKSYCKAVKDVLIRH